MYSLCTLTIAAIKMFVRNRQSLFFAFFMPFIIMGVFGLIGFDNFGTIKLGVVTNNPTPATQQFVEQLGEVEVFKIFQGSESEEREALAAGERSLVMMIPDALMPEPTSLNNPEPQTIKVLTNMGQPQQVQTALAILNQMLDKTTLAISQAPELFKLEVEEVNARNLRYIDFLIPGVVALAVMQMGVFSVAFLFADYKEKGVLKRLRATPMKAYQFVVANVITRLLIALGQTAVLIGVGVIAFKFQVVGSYWLVLLIAVLGGVMFLGLGFTISGIAKTVESVPAIANLVVFPMLFLGGTFFPIETMPDWLQSVVRYMPLTYFSESIRAVMNEGAVFSEVAADIYWMAGWAVLLVFLATLVFRFEERRGQ